MAKNDRILLDGIIDDRVAIQLPSARRDEAFEYFAFEQLLKDYDLSPEEIQHGSIDGRQDGGIDGFFVLVNGRLMQDQESIVWPRSSSELRLFIITCKHHDTFKQSALDSLIATITEVLDFSIDDSALTGAYSEMLLRMRSNLRHAYRKLSPRLSSFSVYIYYASRGDASNVGSEVSARSYQAMSIIKSSFGSCMVSFSFIGATELIELHRKVQNYTLELPFVEALAKGERYIALVRLPDYYRFITDEGKLRRYLFDSNVRDFMGINRVNDDIRATLNNPESPDFWWLNNGVTILATSAAITGKSIQAADIQIANGLQTTESIFRHFSESPRLAEQDDRSALVKVIVTKDETIRDSIIRATNNQTDVELASLHATDKIQRDIEDVLLRHGLYYERRKNFYANQGHKPTELVTPLYAASGYVALVLKSPHSTTSLRSRFMRYPTSYESVFNDKTTLEVWPALVRILKATDTHLDTLRPQDRLTDKFLKGWRYITSFLLVAKHAGHFAYTTQHLVEYDTSLITLDEVEQILHDLSQLGFNSKHYSGWASPRNVQAACHLAASKYNIGGTEALEQFTRSTAVLNNPPQKTQFVSDDFAESVRALLPPQPWKPGLHLQLATQLSCKSSAIYAAIKRLIETGHFYRQVDGILFDANGSIVGFDPDRVNPNTYELRDS